MLQAIIFDMDGVLIDSEPFWRESEIEVFANLGLHLTETDCLETTGMRIEEVAELYYKRTPWEGLSPQDVARDILDGVICRVREKGTPMPGLHAALAAVAATGLPLGLASSSSPRLIQAVLDTLGLEDTFSAAVSAELETRGKPYPDVYLTAARLLGADPRACLAVEDSVRGLQAAKAAGMRCVVIPTHGLQHMSEYRIADEVLDSLTELPIILPKLTN